MGGEEEGAMLVACRDKVQETSCFQLRFIPLMGSPAETPLTLNRAGSRGARDKRDREEEKAENEKERRAKEEYIMLRYVSAVLLGKRAQRCLYLICVFTSTFL